MEKVTSLVVSLQKQLSSSAFGTSLTHKEQSLALIIIIISGITMHQ